MTTAAQRTKIKTDLARWFLRIGLATVYGYVAIDAGVNPGGFLKYVPPLIQHTIPSSLFFVCLVSFEGILTLWLLSGIRTQYAGIISFGFMTLVVLSNLTLFSILFRDLAIALASLALAALDWGETAELPRLGWYRR